MAFSAILRNSAKKAAPFAARMIGSQSNTKSSAAVFSAVKRATLSPRLFHSATYSSVRHFSSNSTSSDNKLVEVLQSEINVVEESEDIDKVESFFALSINLTGFVSCIMKFSIF